MPLRTIRFTRSILRYGSYFESIYSFTSIAGKFKKEEVNILNDKGLLSLKKNISKYRNHFSLLLVAGVNRLFLKAFIEHLA